MSIKSWDVNWHFKGVATSPRRGRGRRPGADGEVFRAELSGFEEVPPVLTPATGTFAARLVEGGSALEYRLSFTNLSTPAFEAHLHFAPPGVNGEIFAFLCGGDQPGCPGEGGTVTGVITAEDILAIPDQGLAAGDFEGALTIMRRGLAYVNVHSMAIPRGEIRGQVRVR